MGDHRKPVERPIAFAAPMVRAILAGRKTQTRRPIVPQPRGTPGDGDGPVWRFGAAGDRLWVRERFAYGADLDDAGAARDGHIVYAADGGAAARLAARPAWRPSRYMPRAASRILLEITACRAERLQGIPRADAVAEGFEPSRHLFDDPVAWFRELWDQLNGGGPFAWRANPWVSVIEFHVLAPAPGAAWPRGRAAAQVLNARPHPSD